MNSHSLTIGFALSRQPLREDLCGKGRKLIAVTVLVVAGVMLFSAPAGYAKKKQPTSKTLTGVVFDDANNPIKGATIELTDVQTGKALDVYSQDDGHYQFTDLLFSHDYKVKATYKESSSEVREVSSFDMRTRPVLNFTIPTPKK